MYDIKQPSCSSAISLFLSPSLKYSSPSLRLHLKVNTLSFQVCFMSHSFRVESGVLPLSPFYADTTVSRPFIATGQAAALDMSGVWTACPSPFCHSFLSSSSCFKLYVAFCSAECIAFECLEGCVFAREPESSFLLEVGPCLWGLGGSGSDVLIDAASYKCWILTGTGLSRVHTLNEVAACRLFSWHSDNSALILFWCSAFITDCHCCPA